MSFCKSLSPFAALNHSARAKPGISFRVGVHPPVDEARLSAGKPEHTVNARGIDVYAMEQQMLLRQTKAAIMRIEIFKVRGPEAETAPCKTLLFAATMDI